RDFDASPDRLASLVRGAAAGLPHKWLHFFPRAVKHAVVMIPSGATGWLVPIGGAVAIARRPTRRLAIAPVVPALIRVAAVTLLFSIPLDPVPFLPLEAIAAAFGAKWLIERLPVWAHRPRVWIALLAMGSVPLAVVQLRDDARLAHQLESWIA